MKDVILHLLDSGIPPEEIADELGITTSEVLTVAVRNQRSISLGVEKQPTNSEEAIIKRYRSGTPIGELSKAFRISPSDVLEILINNEVEPQTYVSAAALAKVRLEQEICEAYAPSKGIPEDMVNGVVAPDGAVRFPELGHMAKDIAEMFGVSLSVVRHVLQKNGLLALKAERRRDMSVQPNIGNTSLRGTHDYVSWPAAYQN